MLITFVVLVWTTFASILIGANQLDRAHRRTFEKACRCTCENLNWLAVDLPPLEPGETIVYSNSWTGGHIILCFDPKPASMKRRLLAINAAATKIAIARMGIDAFFDRTR